MRYQVWYPRKSTYPSSATIPLSPALLAQLVEHLHGKEGVDGSSPSEGSAKPPKARLSLWDEAARFSPCACMESVVENPASGALPTPAFAGACSRTPASGA